MAKILLIDSNPDHRKSLGGLLRHRTSHSVRIVEKNIIGVREAASDQPDLIMVNALLFMDKNYALPRILQQNEKTASIPFLVHTSAELGEVVERQIEASGVAGVLELPVSASELQAGIAATLEMVSRPTPKRKTGVQAVQWKKVEDVSGEPSQSSPKDTVRREHSPQADREDHRRKPVQRVTWPTASSSESRSQKKTRRGTSKNRKSSASGFQSFRRSVPEKRNSPGEFRSSSFQDIESTDKIVGEDPTENKSFKRQSTWDSIDPGQVKNKNRKRKE